MIAWLQRYAWLLFAIAAIFTLLGQRGLNEPDEGRYAEISREMSVDGDWLVPHLNGLPHFQKPPILYWLTALSLRTFGHAEWAARLPSALAALGVVILTFLLGRRLLADRDQAIAAALVLTSLGGFFAMSRLLTPDMTMTFWITAAITAALSRRQWLFFILMGLGFLTKGPMALVVPLCAVLGWNFTAAPAEKLHLPWWRGLTLTAGISLSWFIALSLRDSQLFEYFWRYELVERFGSSSHGRSKPFWFFLVILPLALLPWIFLMPLRRIWQSLRSGKLTAWQGLLLGWSVPPLLILSCSGSKLPTYVLPLLPAFALGIAAAVPSLRRAWIIAVPTIALLILGDFAIAHNNDLLGAQASSRELVRILHEQEPDVDEAILFACGTRTQGLAFYTARLLHITRGESDLVGKPNASQSKQLYTSARQCVKKLTNGPPAHGMVRLESYHQLFDPKKWRIIAQSGVFALVANHAEHEPDVISP
jgi:4-amino-4-deoxy-L-arabinose transferase-like glycosyltransferase